MKRKHACGLLAISVLLALLMPLSTQAEPDALEWTEIDKPGLRGNIVVSPSEVSEIAVGRRGTIYAIDSENSKVYQSLNAGGTWQDITSRLVEAGAGFPVSKIAIAPDTTSTVAVVSDNGTEVYLSTDGGNKWKATIIPSLAGTIQAITISKQYTEADKSLRDIVIGTAAWGNNTTTGQVWVLQSGELVSSWKNQSLTVDPSHLGGEVSAIAYSPNYHRDNTIIVVAATGDDVAADYKNKTWLCIGKRDAAAGTTSWDSFSGYPAEIATTSSPSAGDATGVLQISSSLALPSNYSGSDEALRQLFVSYNRNPDAHDDVYRFSDTSAYRLDVNNGEAIDISSIAYYGTTTSGKLLAGEASPAAGSPTVQVWRTSNPFESPPTWNRASMPPTGPGNARISWSPEGNSVYCGTGQSPGDDLDESAFSMSSDDGDNWQQLSLMDTTLMLSDITPAPDSKTLFIATYSTFGPEGVWRSASTQAGIGEYWSRQLTMDTTSDRIILRLSSDYASDYTIYAAETGGDLMAVSHNRGNSWKRCRPFGPIVDMAFEDKDTLYVALPDGYIRKSINSGVNWLGRVYAGLPDINMLAIAEKGTILVGGRNGEVAYSTDGGVSFTKIDEVIDTGDVQVVADSNYKKNGIIYAVTDAPDEGVWRWAMGLSTQWEQIDESMTTLQTEQSISGLAMSPEGTLYALRLEEADSTSGGMTRLLNPSETEPSKVEFDLINFTLPEGATFDPTLVFPNTLPHLKLSGDSDQNELWAIDTANEIIYRFQDILCKTGPTPEKPNNGEIIPITARDGGIYPTLIWEASPWADEYEIAVYLDPDCIQRVWTGTSVTEGLVLIGDNKLPPGVPGTTYYWRVRAADPIKSPWSETWSFTSAHAGVWAPLTLLSPELGAKNVALKPAFAWNSATRATAYDFVLARDSQFTDVVIAVTDDDALPTTLWSCDTELEYETTYFWKVRAINATNYSEWATSVFTTTSNPVAEPPPPASLQPAPPQSAQPPTPSVPSPPPPIEPMSLIPSQILWATISIGAALVIALLVLIIRTGR
ncbi:hypothetical protein ACFLVW_00140 [Chloroflexota bacterium]